MRHLLRAAMLAATLATGAHADEDWYELGTVLLSPPVLVDSANDGTTITYQVPNYGPGVVVGQPSLKSCKKWEDLGRSDWAALPKPTIDKYLTVTVGPTNYQTGLYAFVVGDLFPGSRQQWVCPRLPFVRTYSE